MVDLYLNNAAVKQQWQQFLTSLGITNFSAKEVDQIDFTVGIYDGERLVATGSAAGNVLKYIGVCNLDVTAGARFNLIVSELVNRLFRRGVYHLMVFTKLKYSLSFQHVGFTELAHSASAALLETGSPDVTDYLQGLPRVPQQGRKKVAGIVMNANPFTKGHRYLVEQAARENAWVYVFVVTADTSLFTTAERVQLVKAGTQDLDNVMVVAGGDYMVSYATFPAYFLPSQDQTIRYQTTLDARIFRNVIAPALAITTRYVGTEPLSRTTSIYNDVLQAELPPKVALKVVERQQTQTQQYITATQVRRAIRDNQLAGITNLVPASTLAFIQTHQSELRARIKRGVTIAGN